VSADISGGGIHDIADQAGRRWDMAIKLGCSRDTIETFAALMDASSRVSVRIYRAKRLRRNGRAR
jgi:hypothetical protein